MGAWTALKWSRIESPQPIETNTVIKTTYLIFLVNEQGEQSAAPCPFLPNDTLAKAMRAAAKRGFRRFNLVERASSRSARSDHHLFAAVDRRMPTPETEPRLACALRRERDRQAEGGRWT